ncbi:helix-turn-helix domain-containing protein [Streptosporangium sp. KLBMP 9127]|nr:helix-turn-helix domain-containing protein [Streptosporangium sp. KLBMP 9127]
MRRTLVESSNTSALARGLHVLRELVDEGSPLTATEIARRIGVHQSSVSRILATLTQVGYVRKTSDRRFAPDFGVLSLMSATTWFPLIRKPRAAMEAIASAHPGLDATLCVLWRGEMIYFLRTGGDIGTVDFGAGFPVHLSAPGLRMLVDLPEDEALEILRQSRHRYGWPGTAAVPATEEDVLAFARVNVEHDVLVLPEWGFAGMVGAAIPVKTDEDHPVALALTGDVRIADPATLRLWLHDARRTVEAALAAR